MKVEVKKIDATKRELKFEVPKERVAKKLEEVYGELGKVATIKGSRPGKAPRHVIQEHHGKLAEEEMIKKIIPEVYQEALEKEALDPIDMPEIEDVHLKDGIVSFTATLDIKPEVKIKDYKKIKVVKKTSAVTDEEINKTFEFLKKGQGQGKEIAIDDNFARGLGYPSLEDFKTSLKRQMEIDKDRQNRLDVENQIVEYLLKNATLAVPESAVKRQLEHLVEEGKHRLEHQGAKKEDIDKKEEELRKNLKSVAERDIKMYFILGKIAELENITVDTNENLFYKVLAFLLKEADWQEESKIIH